ncbi:MAG: phosphoribosyltransferase [Chitinophagaceae bacterium]|jgi:pyrimidine operon attenuation protein/uracil phosphoribosyltransferase|nr:phosphoribosyltransferase [Chitinophagaceae bacterium]
MPTKKQILDKASAARKMERMALELAEQLQGDRAPVVIIGIRNSGTVIADKIATLLQTYLPNEIRLLSVSLDKNHPAEVKLSENLNLDGLHIVLTDDVTNSGRTLLYALKPLLAFHPKSIQTLVLVERMHKLFPVKPDYVGLSVSTTIQDHIQVEVADGEVTGAYMN